MAAEEDEDDHQAGPIAVPDVELDVSAVFVGDYPQSGPKLILLVVQPDAQAVLAWDEKQAEGWAEPDTDLEDYAAQVALQRQERQEAELAASLRAQEADQHWRTVVWRRRLLVMPLILLDVAMWLVCIITNATHNPLPKLPAIENSQVSIMGWINLSSVGVTLAAFCIAVDVWGLIGCVLKFHIILTLFIVFELVTTVGISLQGLTFFLLWRVIIVVLAFRLRMAIIQYQVLIGTLVAPQQGSSLWVWNHAHSIAVEFCCLLFGMDRNDSQRPTNRRQQPHTQLPTTAVLPPGTHTVYMTRLMPGGAHGTLPAQHTATTTFTPSAWTAPVFLPVSALQHQQQQPRRLVPMIMSSPLVTATATATPTAVTATSAQQGRAAATRNAAVPRSGLAPTMGSLTGALGSTTSNGGAVGPVGTGVNARTRGQVSNDGRGALMLPGLPSTQALQYMQANRSRTSDLNSPGSMMHYNPSFAPNPTSTAHSMQQGGSNAYWPGSNGGGGLPTGPYPAGLYAGLASNDSTSQALRFMSTVDSVQYSDRPSARTTPQLMLGSMPETVGGVAGGLLQQRPSWGGRAGAMQSEAGIAAAVPPTPGASSVAATGNAGAAQGTSTDRRGTEPGAGNRTGLHQQQRPADYHAQLLSIVQDVKALQERLRQRTATKSASGSAPGHHVSLSTNTAGQPPTQQHKPVATAAVGHSSTSAADREQGARTSTVSASTGVLRIGDDTSGGISAAGQAVATQPGSGDDTADTLDVVDRVGTKLNELLKTSGTHNTVHTNTLSGTDPEPIDTQDTMQPQAVSGAIIPQRGPIGGVDAGITEQSEAATSQQGVHGGNACRVGSVASQHGESAACADGGPSARVSGSGRDPSTLAAATAAAQLVLEQLQRRLAQQQKTQDDSKK